MSRYSIEFFKSKYEKLENKKLDDTIYKKLLDLSKKLNCNIEYSKKKRDNEKYLDALKNFKTTQIKQIEEDENKYFQNIRKILNVITDANFKDFYKEINDNLNIININHESKYYEICNKIYKLLSENYLFCKSYSEIFKNIIINHNIFFDILNNNINNFNLFFNNFNYTSPDINYEKFCDYNKQNETRRANILFYSNLFINDTITDENIINIFHIINNKIDEYINLENKNNEVDELSEYNYLIVTTIYSKLLINNSNLADIIFKKINKFSNYRVKDFSSLTNKCIFKHMDIIDELS